MDSDPLTRPGVQREPAASAGDSKARPWQRRLPLDMARAGSVGLFLGYAALAAAALAARWTALDPGTLWFDDVWVAVLTRADLGGLVGLPTPAPAGFVGLLWIARRLIADPEVSLQVLPLLAALAAIPGVGVAVGRATGSAAAGLLGAALFSLNPTVAQYSVFVKHFTLDALVSAVLLSMAAVVLVGRGVRPRHTGAAEMPVASSTPDPTADGSGPSLGGLVAVAAVGAVAPLLSFASVMLAVPLVHVVAVETLRRSGALKMRGRPRRAGQDDAGPRAGSQGPPAGPRAARILLVVAVFDGLLALLYFGYLARVPRQRLLDYWTANYLPRGSLEGIVEFLRTAGRTALEGALPAAIGWAALLAPVGLAWLAARRRRRPLALLVVLFYSAWLALSAMGRYPIGGVRTDVFSYPVTLLLVSAGLYAVLAPLRRWRGRAMAGLAAGVAGAALLWSPGVVYFDVPGDSDVVRRLPSLIGDGGGLVVYPRASFIVGYYSGWPVRLHEAGYLATGYEVRVERPGSLTLPAAAPEGTAQALEDFVDEHRFARLAYVSARVDPELLADELVLEAFEHLGYVERGRLESRRTRVLLMEAGGNLGADDLFYDVGEPDDRRFLGSGWSGRERNESFSFRWATGTESHVVLPLGGSSTTLLRFRAQPLVFPASPSQVIDIAVDGQPLGSVVLEPRLREYELEVPAAALRRRLNDVRFRYAYAVAPRDVMESADDRTLAVLFDHISVEVVHGAAGRQP